jgi:tetratricopeptide (TPR) repeat protein
VNEKSNPRPTVGICLVLGFVTLAIFSKTSGYDFINFDDPDYVAENPIVQKGITWEGVKWAFTTGYACNWHPLTWLSHMLDWRCYGKNAGLHHLTNVFFHVANTILLFLLLRKLTGAIGRSAFVAALFALHPLHVESVAWVSERKDVLSTFFWLTTMWGYTRYAELRSEQSKQAVKFYITALFLFALGLMSKPMLVTLPCVLLLCDFWPLQRFGSERWRKLILEKLPFLGLAMASSVITFFVQRKGGAVSSLDLIPLKLRLANATLGYGRYLGKTLWPDDLAIPYPFYGDLSEFEVVGTILILFGLTAGTLLLARQKPYLMVGWLWFIGTLVPVIGIIQVGNQSMADRYTYVPLIGIFIAATWAAYDVFLRFPRGLLPLCSMGVAILCACAFATSQQLSYWRNAESLFRHSLAITSDNYIAHNYLANALALQGKLDEALAHYEACLKISPKYPDGHNNMAFALVKGHRYDEAIAQYEIALSLAPEHLFARNNLGMLAAQIGKYPLAEQQFSELVRLQPEVESTRYNLANALIAQGKFAEAIPHLEELLRGNPRDVEVRQKLALSLAHVSRAGEAEQNFSEVIREKPNDADAQYFLGLTRVMQKKSHQAIGPFRKAIQLKPEWPVPLNDLAWILATHPRSEIRNGIEAVQLARKACDLTQWKEPQFIGTLDAACAEAGDFAGAIANAEKVRALANDTGRKEIAEAAELRLKLYRVQHPYHQAGE